MMKYFRDKFGRFCSKKKAVKAKKITKKVVKAKKR